MEQFSLGIAWNWEYDADFVAGIERACARRSLTTFRVEPSNIQETLSRLRMGELGFRTFLDRASGEDEVFEPLPRILAKSSTRIFNQYEHVDHAKDKATMHLEFITNGLQVPYTIIVSPYSKKKEIELSLSELAKLGSFFIIKPANTTGGGIGVVRGAESLKDVIETRQHHKNDKYLLQEKVSPASLAERRAWFRVFYAFGQIIPCWWDDLTHIYEELTPAEEEGFGLQPLRSVTESIKQICDLEFFSTEIALTSGNTFVVVDYVNEMCDMRLKSLHVDGVPDSIVRSIASSLAGFLANQETEPSRK